jgi:HlyD family secretion protein
MKMRRAIYGMMLIAIVAVGCGKKDATRTVSGEVEARQIDVASKIPARMDSVLVHEGETVIKGQTLACLDSPEIIARIGQAQGAVDAAKSMLDMAQNGARVEDVEAAKQAYKAARAQYSLAEKSFGRIQSLFDKQSVPAQTRDEAQAKFDAAKAQMKAAEQIWSKARKGARKEEIATARGNYERAQQTLAEVQSLAQEVTVKAPISGEVEKRIVDPGEIVATGYPMLTLVDLNDIWITMYLTEDKMPSVQLGKEFTAIIPALGNKEATFKVDFINPAGEFATRKAVKEQDGFDLKSFEIHLRPVQPVPGLRPGMSARIVL